MLNNRYLKKRKLFRKIKSYVFIDESFGITTF